MISLIAEHPALSVLAAFLLGYTIKWLLDLFVLRERLFTAEARAKRRGEELDSERFAHGRVQAELKSKTSEAETQRKAREAAETTVTSLRAQVATLSATVAQQTAHIHELDQQLAGARIAHAGAETEIRDRSSTANDLALTLSVRDAELATANHALEEARTHLRRLAEECDFAARKVPQLEADLSQQMNTSSALKADLESSLRAHADAQSAAGEARTALAAAHASLESLKKSKAEADAAHQATLAELAGVRQQFSKLQTQLQDVKSDSGPLEQRLRARQDEVKQLTTQLGEAAEEIAALKLRAAQAEANLTAASDTRKTLEREATQRERELAARAEKIVEVEAELKAISHAHAELQADLESRIAAATQAASAMAVAAGATAAQPVPTGNSNDALLAELDQMSRERNELAAELAILRAAAPAKPAKTPGTRRPRKEKTPAPHDADLGLLSSPAVSDGVASAAPAASASNSNSNSSEPSDGADPVEATTLSPCPQALSDVKGIDAVLEQRLYAGGIGSYWSLAQLSDEELARVLELGESERAAVDFDDLRHDAARLARDTQTVGRRWNGAQPDDLERLEGIGPAQERRLHEAGICTYEALAATDAETLATLCPSHSGSALDYDRWIAQARALVAAREG